MKRLFFSLLLLMAAFDAAAIIKSPGAASASGGGASVTFGNSVAATMSSGAQDYGASPPAGYTAGTTNQASFTPNAAGSTLSGLLSPGINGFALVIFNPSSTANITLTHQNAGLAANQFTCPGGVSWIIAPLTAVILIYVTGAGWTIT